MKKLHVLFDLYKANPQILSRVEDLTHALKGAFEDLGIKIHLSSYQFEPHGVTALVQGDDLHFNIHTWPEHGSCAIDLYCTGERQYATEICEAIKKYIEAEEYEMKVLSRTSVSQQTR